MSDAELSSAEIRQWLMDPEQWPNDSYDVDSLEPSATQQRREKALRKLLPAWCWSGERGAAVLSIGAGKAYWERKFWGAFDKIYIIDPSEHTRLSLKYFPIPNAEYLGPSLFDQTIYLDSVPQYAWLGASIHYLFGEFYGWEFMYKLAMMISDTLIIDAGVFDPQTQYGKVFLERWSGEEAFEIYRRSQFSYANFRKCIEGIWEVVAEWPTPWIDGRRSLILKRSLPPIIQKSELGCMELVKTTAHWSVHRTGQGYFKEAPNLPVLLTYDTVSKVMGWTDFVRWRVFDGGRYCGFITRDLGELTPTMPSVSERMHLSLLSWLLPLGLLPGDVARQNIRLCGGRALWMDIDVRSLKHADAKLAAWMVTNIYKQYERIPTGVSGISRSIGRSPDSLVRTQWRPAGTAEENQWREMQQRIRDVVSVVTPTGTTILVVSKGDEGLLQLDGRHAWHFPRNSAGGYAGFYPQDDAQAIALLDEAITGGAGYLVFPNTAFWWLDNYPALRQRLETAHHRLFSDESCIIYRLINPSAGKEVAGS